MPTMAERLDESLREITRPLMHQLAEVELEIEVRETELKELRAARTKLATIARQIDPSLVPAKEKKRKPASLQGTSPEMVEKVAEWFRAHVEEVNANGGVHASGIITREDFPQMSQSVLSRSLQVLHELGVIRLDHTGSGGAKFFKVVA